MRPGEAQMNYALNATQATTEREGVTTLLRRLGSRISEAEMKASQLRDLVYGAVPSPSPSTRLARAGMAGELESMCDSMLALIDNLSGALAELGN